MSFADVQSILGAIGYWLGVLLLVLLALLLLVLLHAAAWLDVPQTEAPLAASF